MASNLNTRNDAASRRIKSAATTLYSDNQTIIAEIRKAFVMMKEVAVDLETDNESDMVKKLDDGAIQLSEALSDCTFLSTAIQSVGDNYQPGSEPTNFSKLLEDEIEKLKAASSSRPQDNLFIRQFQEAIWNVHHTGQPMPGDELEDIVLAHTESNLLNVTCPLTGKPVTELKDPVRSMDCKHVYQKKAILRHIKTQKQCPVTGCPKPLHADRIVCDPLLLVEIEEMRSMSKQSARTDAIEDFTSLNEED